MKPRSNAFGRLLTVSGKSLAALTMMLSVNGCLTNTRDPIPLIPDPSAFCARYYDKDHPPVWIYQSDSPQEKEEKTDLILLWEVECSIDRTTV